MYVCLVQDLIVQFANIKDHYNQQYAKNAMKDTILPDRGLVSSAQLNALLAKTVEAVVHVNRAILKLN